MFGLQNVQPTSRNSAAHLSTKQDDFTSIFSKALIFKEILCRSVAKTEKWTTLVHFSDDFVSFDNWIPVYAVLEQRGLPVWLVDARQMKYVPGPTSYVHHCR